MGLAFVLFRSPAMIMDPNLKPQLSEKEQRVIPSPHLNVIHFCFRGKLETVVNSCLSTDTPEVAKKTFFVITRYNNNDNNNE